MELKLFGLKAITYLNGFIFLYKNELLETNFLLSFYLYH